MLTININISILGAATDKTVVTDKRKVTFTMDAQNVVVEENVDQTLEQTIDAMDIDQPPLVYNFPEFIPVSINPVSINPVSINPVSINPVTMDIEEQVQAMQIFPVQMEIDHSLKFNKNTLIRSTSCTI
jgi:hypothetical protein